jgi:hypothetical protein
MQIQGECDSQVSDGVHTSVVGTARSARPTRVKLPFLKLIGSRNGESIRRSDGDLLGDKRH